MKTSHTDQLFELMSQGIWQVDAAGKTSYVNSRMAAMVGYSREELLPMPAPSLVRQEDRAGFAAKIASRRQGVRDDYECRIAHKDGAWISVAVEAIPVFRDDGAFDGTLALVTDVTERNLARERLEESEARYRRIVDAAGDGIWTLGADGKTDFINNRGAAILGYGAAEIMGRPPSDFVFPEDAIPAGDEVELNRSGHSAARTFRMRHRSGAEVWVDATTVPIPAPSGDGIIGMLSVFSDITERKRIEGALRESEERQRRLVETVPAVLYSYSEGKGGTYYSPQIEAFLGYSARHLREHPMLWHDSIHPDDLPAVDDAIREGSSTGFEIEYRIRDASGKWRWFLDRAVRVTRASGATSLDGIVQDITGRRQADEERAKLEAQLHHAQKMESVGRLAGGVAHDFNNMLGVILGNADAALEQVDPASPIHEDLEEIRKAARRSADLTRQLLAFARKQTVTPKVLDLNDLVAGMLRLLERLIGEDVRVTWLPGEGLWPLKLDPSQIDQTLTNLCVNARDAISGVGKLVIETGNVTLDEDFRATHAGACPGDYVRLCVSDDGCGMDKETKARLFEPFFTTKGVGEGTGLGLATVYGIVKQNNGFIDVASEPGRGTTFEIYLPRYRGTAGEGRAAGAVEPTVRGRETILLVEDEASILRLTRRMLERTGYTVLSAGTPGDAIRLAEAHSGEIHLLITDVVMPELNGRDLAKKLLSLYPGLKRLFMSGYTADVIASHGVLDEGVNFIQKPFSQGDLVARVREALDGKGSVARA